MKRSTMSWLMVEVLFVGVSLMGWAGGGLAVADTFYVSTNSASDGPGTSWANAWHEIQDAIDAAGSSDTVLVTNGVYDQGAVLISGVSNRVYLTKSITLRSVNGPEVTIIAGSPDPATTNGASAVRCVYMKNGTELIGFTMTDGHTHNINGTDLRKYKSGGGVFMESGGVVSNCVITGNGAEQGGGGIILWQGGALVSSRVIGNSIPAGDGGGVRVWHGGTVENCTIADNYSDGYAGGGAIISGSGTIRDCLITGNRGNARGGGVAITSGGTVEDCLISGNEGGAGGGATIQTSGTIRRCVITGNRGSSGGGFMFGGGGVLANCLVNRNFASIYGGGVYWLSSGGTVRNCTIVGNTATYDGGGFASTSGGGQLRNTIIQFNSANEDGDNWDPARVAGLALEYCCVTPTNGLPGGLGCMEDDPRFADLYFRLQANSPCIDAGTELTAVTNDFDRTPRPLDGDASGGPATDIGAMEYARTDVDSDGDGLSDWDEVNVHGTDITLADTDGDGIDDPDEIAGGLNPLQDSSSSIGELSMGYLVLAASNGNMNLDLQLQQTDDLSSGTWSNVGASVEWSEPALDGRQFFRVVGDAP